MNCFRTGCFALAAWLGLGLASGPVWGQGEFKLGPLFAHNMVLQQGQVNTIRGWAKAGEYVAISYRGQEFGPEKVAKPAKGVKLGAWAVDLDLRQQTNAVSGQLLIKTGPKKNLQPAVVLTNVVVGEVWLLGVVNGKGLPAPGPQPDAKEKPKHLQPDFLRFVTVSNLSSLADISPGPGVSWNIGSPGFHGFEELRMLAYYWAFHWFGLHSGRFQYIGIIQVRTNDVAPLLRPGSTSSSANKAHMQRAEELHAARTIAYENAKSAVAQAQYDRRKDLIAAKHAGKVIQPAPIFQYDPPNVYLPEAFKAKLPPWLPSFEGAVW